MPPTCLPDILEQQTEEIKRPLFADIGNAPRLAGTPTKSPKTDFVPPQGTENSEKQSLLTNNIVIPAKAGTVINYKGHQGTKLLSKNSYLV